MGVNRGAEAEVDVTVCGLHLDKPGEKVLV